MTTLSKRLEHLRVVLDQSDTAIDSRTRAESSCSSSVHTSHTGQEKRCTFELDEGKDYFFKTET